ncbi:MAG: ABC transporter ATP-binding protein [Ruminiclostridium sp.]|jgi:peptide/nickel transport system ATP-binding protein|nr:ABC transporter ATP-binding protein [Ruminiclostridium sp.]
MSQENTALDIQGLQVCFPGGLAAVDGVDLSIPAGKIVGLVGESGCGKSMTALSILGLLPQGGAVTAGSIRFQGQDLCTLPERQLRQLRGERISMIFQDPMSALNPVLPVGEQVAEGLRLHQHLRRREAKARTLALFGEVGVPDPERRWSAYPRELSGGLCQRVMIAMAMACRPAVLLADEPTTALDVTIQAQILRLMARLSREAGTAILLITHNMGVVAQLCDMVYVMYAGEIVEQAETFSLFDHPRHPYTQGLLRAIPSLEAEQASLYAIPGTVPKLGQVPEGCRFSSRCDQAGPACRRVHPPLREAVPGHRLRCILGDEGP